jgi:outer membrane protein OmpA-like peptidoglycan-associated protein
LELGKADMTKPLNTQLSQHEGPAPRTGSRTRTLLVALLGFGAADLLVLNLWAVPKLITTTDVRAAQSGDPQPEAATAPAASAEPQPAAPQAEQPMAAVAEPAAPEQPMAAVAEPAAAAAAAAPEQPEGTAQQALAQAEAAPALEGEHPAVDDVEATNPPPAVEDAKAPKAQLAAAQPEAYTPTDPNTPAPFAIKAAQRAVRSALAGAATGGNGPFDELGDADQPLAQIFFSLGNFTLGPNGKQILERKLTELSGDERPILIVGCADPSGSEQVNEKLSDARAQSVAEWMLAHGVDATRIQTRAIGHEGAVGSTLDRRVDIWLGGSR